MKRLTGWLATLALASFALAACGSDDHVAYRPSSFGVPGQCYYVQVPDEAITLISDGLCQPGWAPTLAPSWWTLAYAGYLFGPSSYYVSHYVPVQNRVNYSSYGNTYVTVHKTEIVAAERTARYTGSDGKTATGEKVAKATRKSGAGTFGGGARTGFGGGTRTPPRARQNSSGYGGGTARSATAPRSKSGSTGKSGRSK